MTERQFLKSIVLFILFDVDEESKESAVSLYQRWQQKTGASVTGQQRAAWMLEYLVRLRNCRRDALKEAAIIDGYIAE